MGFRNGETVLLEGSREARARDAYRRSRHPRNSAGLRDMLFDAMDALKRGDIEAYDAKAIAALANAICKTVYMEVNMQRWTSDRIIEDDRPRIINLGSDEGSEQ